VILAHRPPISIPRTNISPALLDELISEMSTLASVYHKPAGTFIGLGRIGADSVQRKGECVFINSNLSTRMRSHARFSAYRTTNSLHRGRSKPSQRVNRLKTFSTLMMFLQINHLDWPLHKFPLPYPQLRTLSRVHHRTHSTTSSPSLEIWVPHNRHPLRRLHRIRSVHHLHYNYNLNSSRTRSVDWVAWVLHHRSLLRHHNRPKSRKKICWVYSRAVVFSFSIYHFLFALWPLLSSKYHRIGT
jgi:hypothetical protein